MTNLLLKKDLSAEQLAMVQSEVNAKGKSKTTAFLFWFFLGGLGGHRYYAGKTGSAIAQTLTLGGLGIWAFIDVFFIGGMIEKHNEKLELETIVTVQAMSKTTA